MEKENHIDFLNGCKESHIGWADYFEDNPEIESVYVATEEWDSASKHRTFADKYQEVIDYIKETENAKNRT